MSSPTANKDKLVKAVAKAGVKLLPLPPLACDAIAAVIDSIDVANPTQSLDPESYVTQIIRDTVQDVSGAFDGLDVPEFVLVSVQEVLAGVQDLQELVVSLDLDVGELYRHLQGCSERFTVGFSADEMAQYERVLAAVAHAIIANAQGLKGYGITRDRALLRGASAAEKSLMHSLTQGPIVQSTAAQVASIYAAVVKGNASEVETEERPPSEERWDGMVDAARLLLDAGEYSAARMQLQDLRSQLQSESPSPRLQCRIAANLGVIALHLGDLETAARETDRATAYDPKNIAALTNSSSIAMLSGNAGRALDLAEKARGLNANSPVATATYIQALVALDKQDAVDALISAEPWVTVDPLCCLTLGEAAFRSSDFDQAEKFLRRSLETQPNDARARFLLGLTLLQPALSSLMAVSPLEHRQPADVLERVRRAETELTEALLPTSKRSNPTLKRDVLVNRAAARGALGDFTGAISDCEAVLKDEPGHGMALYNKGMLLLRQGRFPEAATALRVSTSAPNVEREIPLAAALIETGEYTEAIGLVRPLWEAGAKDERALNYADLLLTAYDSVKDRDAAEGLVREIGVRFPGDAEASVILGEHWRRRGDLERAVSAYRMSLDSESVSLRDRASLHLASLFFGEGAWDKAAEQYAGIVDTTTDNPLLRRYIVCLVNAHHFADVLEIARPIRETEGPKPLVTEGEACALAYIGDLNAALPLFHALAELEPKKGSHRVNIVLALRRQGDDEGARTYLDSIPPGALDEDPQALMRIAAMRSTLDMPGVLEAAFRARDLDFHNPDAHIDYMGICLHAGRVDAEAAVQPLKAVRVGCRVDLKGGKDRLHFTVRTVGEPLHGESREISADSPMAKDLLGKRIGEVVRLGEGAIGEQQYVIEEVFPKYVAAFRNSSDLFKERVFPQSRIQVLDVTEEGFGQRLADHLDAAYRRSVKLLDLYAEGPVPLSMLAEAGKHTLVETWEAMTTASFGKIFATSGAADDAEAQQRAVAAADRIVVDLTALLGIVRLGMEDAVAARFREIIVPQHVIDEVREHIFKLTETGPTGGMWSEGVVRHIVDPDPVEHERRLEFARRVLDFTTEHTHVVAVPSLAGVSPHVVDALGIASAATVSLAQEWAIPLFSDDARQRAFAMTAHEVLGFSSPELLARLHADGCLSRDTYFAALTSLITANYLFVRVTAEYLLWVLEKDAYRGSTETLRVFRALKGPAWDELPVLRVLATVAVQVARNASPFHASLSFDLCVSTALAGRKGMRTFQTLGRMLKALTRTDPILSDRLQAHLRSYDESHVIGM